MRFGSATELAASYVHISILLGCLSCLTPDGPVRRFAELSVQLGSLLQGHVSVGLLNHSKLGFSGEYMR